MPRRLAIDLSGLLRWTGPPVGVPRVEAEIARHALGRDDVDFVFFDTGGVRFRIVEAEAVRSAVAGSAMFDTSDMPDPRLKARSPTGAFLFRLERYLRPFRRPRRFAIDAMESARRRLRAGTVFDAVTRMQEGLFTARYRQLLFDEDGERRVFQPIETALGAPFKPGRETVIFSAGLDWNTKNPLQLRALKEAHGCRFVSVCHDLIPIDMPELFSPEDVAVVTTYFRHALDLVDRFVAVSRVTARDLRAFAAREHRGLADIEVQAPGATLPAAPSGELPAGLAPRRYILFVSTVEPRKNHALLLRVWRRLNAAGIADRTGMKLVFVGRRGWNVDALTQEIAVAENLLHLTNVRDGLLSLLYENAAFCVYPSLYEGYGLPVVEAFQHGRPVIGSTGGAVPETMAGLGPSLDPHDDDAWTATLEKWMTEPSVVAEREQAIRTGFRALTWKEAAGRYLGLALSVFDLPPR